MPFDINASLGALSLIISLGMVIGGLFALRSGFFKQSSQIQEQTISALKARVDTLESQAEADAKEIKRLRTIINTVRYALKRRGLLIEIEGEYVTLVENSSGQSKSTRLHPEDTGSGRLRPLKKPDDEDDAI